MLKLNGSEHPQDNNVINFHQKQAIVTTHHRASANSDVFNEKKEENVIEDLAYYLETVMENSSLGSIKKKEDMTNVSVLINSAHHAKLISYQEKETLMAEYEQIIEKKKKANYYSIGTTVFFISICLPFLTELFV